MSAEANTAGGETSPMLKWAYRGAALGLLLALFAFYAPVLRVAPLHDDALLIGMLRERPLWGSATSDPLFRPAAYLLWQVVRVLFGWYEAPLLKMFNLAAHVLSTALVIKLAEFVSARAARSQRVLALIAGALFGWYPLFYQAMFWSSALVHPLFTLFGLLAVHIMLKACTRRGAQVWAQSALATGFVLLASLSNEAGFMSALWTGLAVMRCAWRDWHQHRALHFRAVLVLPLLAGVGYVLVYRLGFSATWSSKTPVVLEHPLQAAQNLAYFLQALGLPLAALARAALGIGAARYWLAAGSGIVILVLCLAYIMRGRQVGALLFALGWWGISSALFSVVLSHDYVLQSPRLTYAPMVGGVLMWSVLLLSGQHKGWRMGALGAALAWIVWSARWMMPTMAEAEQVSAAMRTLRDDLRDLPATAPVLLINAPFWNAPSVPTFLIGAEGMPLIAEFGPLPLWVGSLDGVYRDVRAVQHAISLSRGTTFTYGLIGEQVDDGALRAAILASRRVYRFDYDPPLGTRVRRLAAFEPAAPQAMPLARFSHEAAAVHLLEARLVRCDDQLLLHLTWQNEQPPQQPTGVFVHGYDAAGAQLWVADRDLIEGYLPLEQLPGGVRVQETRLLPQAPETARVLLGVYERGTLTRYTALLADGRTTTEVTLEVPTATSCAR